MTDLLLSTVIQTLVDWDTQIFLAINGLHNDYWDNFMQMFSGRFIWLPFYLSIAYVMFRCFPWRVNVTCLIVLALLITINAQMSGSHIRSFVGRLRPDNTDTPKTLASELLSQLCICLAHHQLRPSAWVSDSRFRGTLAPRQHR